MPDLVPFRGYRFSPDLGERLADILAPPYDNISPRDLRELWDSHPFNAARLVLPPPDIAGGDFAVQSATRTGADWYAGARHFLDDWIRQGVLEECEPGLYYYCQDFSLDGRGFRRWGVIGALALDDKDETLPHERTFEGPKADRFRLLKASQANVCSIFLVATDPQRVLIDIASKLDQPTIECRTRDGVRHRLYLVRDQNAIQTTRAAVRTSTLMIADGHHRYETARNYRAWVRENVDPAYWSAADAVMACVCPMPQEGLVILPTHRIVRDLSPGWLDRLSNQPGIAAGTVSGTLTHLLGQLQGLPQQDAAVGVTDGDRFQLLVWDNKADPETYRTVHPVLRNMDVTFLHRVILSQVLKVSEGDAARISYLRNPQEALAQVVAAPGSGAFFVRAPNPEQVMAVSRSGQRMPHKSTDFFPKIPTGLVIRLLREPPAR